MARPDVLASLPVEGGTPVGNNSKYFNFLPILNTAGVLDPSFIPGSVIDGYQGVWNASTNSPAITSSVGTAGYYYIVTVAGTTSIDGTGTWDVGDTIIFNGSTWQRIPVAPIDGGTIV